ncbi:MAG: MBL fold metallo-hydrolase [Phycisphaerales bacterium]|nr:MBL fold metallo-hydrolase [Phycisphaerales bacterium]
MKLRFLGANRQVTGSCYLLEAAGMRILVDCGLFQERPFLDRNWDPFPEPINDIDFLLLTHAHLDHCGRIPRLVKQGFRAPILATAPSRDLARLVMLDSAGIQEEDAQFKAQRHQKEGRRGPHPEAPLYTVADAEAALPLFRTVAYHEPVRLGDHITATYRDAGHILGSAFLEIEAEEEGQRRRIVFSGDVGQHNKPIIRDPEDPPPADVLIMESTYGDRDHHDAAPIQEALGEEINAAMQAGGNLLIPTFAIERAQELLFHLRSLLRAGRIHHLTVFLDSPMAVDATELFERYQSFMDEHARALFEGPRGALRFPGLHLSRTREESQAINRIRGGAIIMAGAGMCTGGRIKHHLDRNIMNPDATILFVGYQSPGTLGRQILDGNPQVRIHGQMHPVRARIRQVSGMSAHADRAGLLGWFSALKTPPALTFLTHGEEAVALNLAEELRRRGAPEVRVPQYRETVDLT